MKEKKINKGKYFTFYLYIKKTAGVIGLISSVIWFSSYPAQGASYVRCMSCHAKHNNGLEISLEEMKKLSIEKIRKVILQGKGRMPAQNVSDKTAAQIAKEIKNSDKF